MLGLQNYERLVYRKACIVFNPVILFCSSVNRHSGKRSTALQDLFTLASLSHVELPVRRACVEYWRWSNVIVGYTDEADSLYLSEYAWQAAVTGSGDQSVQYLYFFPPHLLLSVPITTPLCGMCATVAADTRRQNELIDAVAMGGLVEPESQCNSES